MQKIAINEIIHLDKVAKTTMYHVSPSRNRDSILHSGLLANSTYYMPDNDPKYLNLLEKPGRDPLKEPIDDEIHGVTFVMDTPQMAEAFGRVYLGLVDSMDVWAVDVSGIPLQRDYIHYIHGPVRPFFTYVDIPPDRLHLLYSFAVRDFDREQYNQGYQQWRTVHGLPMKDVELQEYGDHFPYQPQLNSKVLSGYEQQRQQSYWKVSEIITLPDTLPSHPHDDSSRRTFIYLFPIDKLFIAPNNAYHNDIFEYIYKHYPKEYESLFFPNSNRMDTSQVALGFVERNYEDHALEARNYWAEGEKLPDAALYELEEYFGEPIYQTNWEYPRAPDPYDRWDYFPDDSEEPTKQWPGSAAEGAKFYTSQEDHEASLQEYGHDWHARKDYTKESKLEHEHMTKWLDAKEENRYGWHQTDYRAVDSIMKHGILPRSERVSGRPKGWQGVWAPRKNHVYVGVSAKKLQGGAASGYGAKLKIDLDRIHPEFFDSDEDAIGGAGYPIPMLPGHEQVKPNPRMKTQYINPARYTNPPKEDWSTHYQDGVPNPYKSWGEWADAHADIIDQPKWVQHSMNMGSVAIRHGVPPEAIVGRIGWTGKLEKNPLYIPSEQYWYLRHDPTKVSSDWANDSTKAWKEKGKSRFIDRSWPYVYYDGQLYVAPGHFHYTVMEYLRRTLGVDRQDLLDNGLLGWIDPDTLQTLEHTDNETSTNWHDNTEIRQAFPNAIKLSSFNKIAFDTAFIYTGDGHLYVGNKPHPQILREHNIGRETPLIAGIIKNTDDELYMTFYSWSQDFDDPELQDGARQAIEHQTGKFPIEVSYDELVRLDSRESSSGFEFLKNIGMNWGPPSVAMLYYNGKLYASYAHHPDIANAVGLPGVILAIKGGRALFGWIGEYEKGMKLPRTNLTASWSSGNFRNAKDNELVNEANNVLLSHWDELEPYTISLKASNYDELVRLNIEDSLGVVRV